MKRVLITGEKSYIGTSIRKYLEDNRFRVVELNVKNEKWKEHDFSKYDVVINVAGIAHVKETSKNRELYYKVNRDLAIEIAKFAKSSGIKQFINLSSMSVYGITEGIILKNTIPVPKNAYGDSKLQADNCINELQDSEFKVAILRPPMVYGKDCKGNYNHLRKFALMSPIFPKIRNKRSMIYIDNLSYFVHKTIVNESSGIFLPQNASYVSTSDMLHLVSNIHGKRRYESRILGYLLKVFSFKIIKKAFGDLVYEKCDSVDYIDFETSVRLTEQP